MRRQGPYPHCFCSTETFWPFSRVKCWLAFCCALLGSCLHRFYKPQVKGSKLQSDNLERDSQLQLPFVCAAYKPMAGLCSLWTISLFILKTLLFQGSPTNLTCLQHLFSYESRSWGQIKELRGRWQPVACEPLLFNAFAGSMLRVTKENHLYFVFFPK